AEELGSVVDEAGCNQSAYQNTFDAASGNIELDLISHEKSNALPLADRRCHQCDGGMVGAEHGHDLVLRDQPQGLVLANLWIALVVDVDELDFRAAEIGQSGGRGERKARELGMRGVDDVRSELD